MLQKLRGKKGFTLIELMIVVAIIGILAAIAIPNFLNYQKKSKTAEAKTNIGGIKTSEIAYQSESGLYAVCTAVPDATAVGPAKQEFVQAGGWTTINWTPSGMCFYSYEVTTGGTATANQMVVGAIGDIDGDGINGEFGYASDTTVLVKSANMVNDMTVSGTLEDMTPGVF